MGTSAQAVCKTTPLFSLYDYVPVRTPYVCDDVYGK